MELLEQIAANLQQGEDQQVRQLTARALADGLAPGDILDRGLIAGMNVIGERFRKHEIFLPTVLLAAKAMMAGIEQLKPLLLQQGIPSLGKVVIGTVQGDLHDIGKNLVGIMLRGAGYEVIDLGKDVPAERFVDTALREQAQVIGLSALLTTTMPVMKAVMDLLQQRAGRDQVKVIIGGAPASAEYAREIGADAYGYDAAKAVVSVQQLLQAGG